MDKQITLEDIKEAIDLVSPMGEKCLGNHEDDNWYGVCYFCGYVRMHPNDYRVLMEFFDSFNTTTPLV